MFSTLGQRVGVVEDEAAVAEVITEVLREGGFDTSLFPVLAPAMLSDRFEEIRRQHIRVLLVDLHLPGVSGLDLIDRIRNDPDPMTNRMWVTLLTGEELKHASRLARQHGADNVLNKPFDNQDLIDSVRHGLERVNQLMSDPTTGIPGLVLTGMVLPEVLNLPVPWAVLSTDWNGYGNLIEVAGAVEAEQTLRRILRRWEGAIDKHEKDPKLRFIGQLGQSDGTLIICPAEKAIPIAQDLIQSFNEEVRQAYLTIGKSAAKIISQGFAIRTVTETDQGGRPVRIKKILPNVTLSIGINSSVWFRGIGPLAGVKIPNPIQFDPDGPYAWQAEPCLVAPREMIHARMVRLIADRARRLAEDQAKSGDPGNRRHWVAIHNRKPWDELSAKEQEEYRVNKLRRKFRGGREVLVNQNDEIVAEREERTS